MVPEERSGVQPRNRVGPRPLRRAVALAVALLVWLPGDARSEETPAQVVEAFHAALLGVMKEAEALPVEARFERLEEPVKQAFYLPLMIRIASGGFWQQASEEQQQRLLAAFERMSVGSYAYRFDGYSGEVFETVGEAPGPRGTTLVETRIVRPDDDPVRLVYVMRPVADGYRIVDVLLTHGVSELAVRRSEYQSVLEREGVEGLIAALDRKADDLIAEPAAP